MFVLTSSRDWGVMQCACTHHLDALAVESSVRRLCVKSPDKYLSK